MKFILEERLIPYSESKSVTLSVLTLPNFPIIISSNFSVFWFFGSELTDSISERPNLIVGRFLLLVGFKVTISESPPFSFALPVVRFKLAKPLTPFNTVRISLIVHLPSWIFPHAVANPDAALPKLTPLVAHLTAFATALDFFKALAIFAVLAPEPIPGSKVAASNPRLSAKLPTSPQSNPSLATSAPKPVKEPTAPTPAPAILPNPGTKVAPKEAASATKAAISALSAAVNWVWSPITFSSPALRILWWGIWRASSDAEILVLLWTLPPIW